MLESVEIFAIALNIYLDGSRDVAHPAVERMQCSQPVNEGTEPDALHNASHAKKPRCNRRSGRHASLLT